MQECDSIMEEHGVSLVQTLGSVLALSLSDQICEQVSCRRNKSLVEMFFLAVCILFILLLLYPKALCVLVNLSNGCVRSRDRIAECVLVVECLAQLLVSQSVSQCLGVCGVVCVMWYGVCSVVWCVWCGMCSVVWYGVCGVVCVV